MPQRKRCPTAADATGTAESSNGPKRQRVSLACDACRTAREKCDGARPECGTCRTQRRSCSYTPTSKKRGVKTGYLRTIELSLAWLFDEVPDAEKALHRVLSENNGTDAIRLFVAKGKASDRLHRKWTKSRIHRDIENVISRDQVSPGDVPADESGDETSESQGSGDSAADGGSSPTPAKSTEQQVRGVIPAQRPFEYPKLPGRWRRYVDIYFSYTHCWLPIVYRDDVFNTASSYSPEKPKPSTHSDPYTTSCHAQLWAILAVGAFQDASCDAPAADRDASAKEIYATAKQLIPGDDSNFERPMMCTLILHALISMGKGKTVAAWLITGRAMRLLLSTDQHKYTLDTITSRYLANNPVLAACHLLDTVLSTCLGRPTHLTAGRESNGQSLMTSVAPEAPEAWNPVSGFGTSIQRQPISGYPFLTLYQLLEFSIMTGAKLQSEKQQHQQQATVRRITTDDLVRSLHPQLQFCSSFNVGNFVPNMPSALLLQIAFLTSTILISGYRASLLSALLEIIEQSLEHFGACGMPPLVACFMDSVEKKINFEDMRLSERSKWTWLREKLLSTWRADEVLDTGNSYGSRGTQQQTYSSGAESFTPQVPNQSYRPSPTSGILDDHSQGNRLAGDVHASYLEPYTNPGFPREPAGTGISMSPAIRTPSIHAQASPDLSRQGVQQFPTAAGGQLIDYDAIFDELGSIDYGDTMEMDPQFMANLGFAPGCNVADMFQGDFGG